ncbi:MAG: BrnT family toxin [Acidobacteriaceae bacterium]|nr:BrnT family toxin [Acidobacteriaceae bacterium]MBV9781015.1 BrnT family toxin [Acidobacteriaceae bacterium]
MHDWHFHFEWDEVKAARNERKHGVAFDLARSIFNDPRLVTVADLDHSEGEERWFSIGRASNGVMLSVAYLWERSNDAIKIRIISARKATRAEISQYEESL